MSKKDDYSWIEWAILGIIFVSALIGMAIIWDFPPAYSEEILIEFDVTDLDPEATHYSLYIVIGSYEEHRILRYEKLKDSKIVFKIKLFESDLGDKARAYINLYRKDGDIYYQTVHDHKISFYLPNEFEGSK